MKRTCKRLISMLLAFVMLFAMFGMAQTVYALDHIQNVSSLGGVLKWSAFPGAKCYYFSFGTGGGYATSPFDMKAFFAKIGKDSGTYNISLYALDGYLDEGGKQISEKWTSKYTYTSTQTKLATPTNLKWSGNVASWSAVPYAQKYELALYRDGNRTRIIGGLTSTSIDLSNYYAEGTHTYKFSIAAKAEGYITSQEAVSPSVTRTGDLPALQNVSFIGGVLKWSAFSGAKCYFFSYGSGGAYVTSPFDVKAYFDSRNKESGTYDISLYALDGYADAGGKQISKKWTFKYTYTSAQKKLATPTNLKWTGNVASWSAVPNAKKYELTLYRDTAYSKTVKDITSTSVDLSGQLSDGTYSYKFSIVAKADGYTDSDMAYSPSVTRTTNRPALQNVKFSNGVLSWDPFSGAKYYYFSYVQGGGYVTSPLDVKEFFKKIGKESGTYNLSLYALDGYADEGGKQISATWTTTYNYSTLPSLKNVKLSSSGVLSWDSFPGAGQYYYSFGNHSGYEESTSINLKEYFRENGFSEGTYNIKIYAMDNYGWAGGKQISDSWSATYYYSTAAPKPLSNVRIINGVLSWDSFAGAGLYFYTIGPAGGYVDGTSLDLNAYCSESGFEKGTYNVGLYAMDKYGWEGGEQISAAWTGSFTFSGQSSTFNHGDVDKNGAVNTADALMALKMAVGIIKPTNEQKNIADVDKDGKITTADALAILKYAVGIIKSF